MADPQSIDGPSTSQVSDESSESTVELNIKTLDSQIYTFEVDKNMPVSSFKEKIANKIGVPIGQQRLIFRGKVLKDEHVLSEYHVENGHTLHLVERQPAQSQPSSGASSGETNGNNGGRGNDAGAGGPRGRVGQISHSVVLGTFNVGDQQGEGIVPDLSRVIGAVLNSFGIGGQPGSSGATIPLPTLVSNATGQAQQANGAEGTNINGGSSGRTGNQTMGPSQPFQSMPQVIQVPLAAAAIPIPSLNAPIPDSLNTLSEFINRMELAWSHNAFQPNQSANNVGGLPRERVELPSNARGVPTPEALGIILRHAQQLLRVHANAALDHIAGRLEREGASSDVAVRGQIQSESMQLGLAIHHLGALFLELGRTILTLRMGQSQAESFVNSGPAVYISPLGPNPIMVQPFPLQTSSLLGGFAVPPLNTGNIAPVGVGNPRHINIHIHAGTALAPIISAVGPRPSNAEGIQALGEPGATRSRNDGAFDVASRPTSIAVSGAPQSTSESVSLPSAVASGVNSLFRSFVDNMRGDNQASSGSTVQNLSVEPGVSHNVENDQVSIATNKREHEKPQSEIHHSNSSENVGSVLSSKDKPSTSQKSDISEGADAIPLGLGLGGLQPKRRTKQSNSLGQNNDGEVSSASSNQNQQTMITSQQLLQSLASRSSAPNRMENMASRGQSGQVDLGNIMSQVLRSPPINNLLTGVSEQTGVVSPDGLRSMFEQLTQSPEMRNTVNQIAQQVNPQDLANMFSGQGGSGGGGGSFDLSRMVQQMMPVVSRALGGGLVPSERPISQSQHSEGRPSGDDRPNQQTSEVGIQQLALQIEQEESPEDIFRGMVENAVHLAGSGSSLEDLVEELCNSEGLAHEFMEMLRDDVNGRLQR